VHLLVEELNGNSADLIKEIEVSVQNKRVKDTN
jgi:hypothetical protein